MRKEKDAVGDKSKNKKESKKTPVGGSTTPTVSTGGKKEPKVKEEKGKAGAGTVIRVCSCTDR